LNAAMTSAIALVMAAFSIVMLAALWRRVGPQLRIPIAVYVAAILAMGISALTTGSAWVIAGAVLFIASDGLLATERFLFAAISPQRLWMRYAVWVLYYAAQLAITLGFLLA
ncbi:MAG: lysoplasmalogenase, partial [Mesorhizobium sp.]